MEVVLSISQVLQDLLLAISQRLVIGVQVIILGFGLSINKLKMFQILLILLDSLLHLFFILIGPF
jgi:hypothetical protein